MKETAEIHDRELVKWVADFLWRWEQSGGLYAEAAEQIVSHLILHASNAGRKQRPSPQDRRIAVRGS